MLTTTEIFQISRDHLLAQKERAINEDRMCVYRAGNGKKCAVGCLIPEKHYRPDIERCSVLSITSTMISKKSGTDKLELALRKSGINTGCRKTMNLLAELQKIHDSKPPEKWESELRELKFDLDKGVF